MISVVLVSNLMVLREGMKRILQHDDDIDVVAEIHAAKESLRDRQLLADVVVIAGQPMDEGHDYLLYLRQEFPSLQIVIVTRFPSPHQIVSAVRVGVRGFMDACSATSHLGEAIRTVASGRLYMHEAISSVLSANSGKLDTDHAHNRLTPRELDIFMRLATGTKVSEIAEKLGISIKTVSTHKTRLMEKMRLTSSSQIVQYAIMNRLFDRHGPVE
ncbi:MAG: LuxR C-terminal-related transcriptional regulator [Janthinobacterium lividum]